MHFPQNFKSVVAILQSHFDSEEGDKNLLQYCHTLLMLRAWHTRQRLVCNVHPDGKLLSLFIPWLGPPPLIEIVSFSKHPDIQV